jgi:hypothetical protein
MKLPFPIAASLLLLGLTSMVVGIALVYPPAALIVGGGALAAGVWLGVDV